MSEAFVNQITLDCLLNKEMYSNHLRSKKTSQKNKEERKFYRKRSFNLFKEMISGNSPEDLPPDVKYAYDNFLDSTIHYFKTIDNNDIIQSEYKDVDISLHNSSDIIVDSSANFSSSLEADKLLLRSVKIDVPTLDKYVKRTYTKKKEAKLILPQQREINLNDPELKNKGLKKNNITNIYEDKKNKNKDEKNET
jgi:hypothetical protein